MIRSFIVSVVCATSLLAQQSPAPDLVLKVAAIHVGNGTIHAPGVILLSGGRIQGVGGGDLSIPDGTRTLDLGNAVITPGLIEASSSVGLNRGTSENEEGRECTPSWRASWAFDARDPALQALIREGVTSLVIQPGDRNIIGGLACWAKASGPDGAARVANDAVALRVTLGTAPGRGHGGRGLMARRPNSRMSTIFELRRQLERVRQLSAGQDADSVWSPTADEKVLLDVLEGRMTMMWEARTYKDIFAALRLAKEFGIERNVLVEAIEADRAAIDLAATNTPVLVGPITLPQYQQSRGRGRAPEELAAGGDHHHEDDGHGHSHDEHGHLVQHPCLVGCEEDHVHVYCNNPAHRHDETDPTCLGHSCCAAGFSPPQQEHEPARVAKGLWKTGVNYGFTAGKNQPGATLLDYVRFAVRDGLPRKDALSLVTLKPAEILGISDRVGSLEPGKDADLVVFTRDPVSPASAVELVIVDGIVAYDPNRRMADKKDVK